METLSNIENNNFEKPENRKKAAGLKTNLSKFDSVFMAIFWTSLLQRFDKTSIILQSTSDNVEDVVNFYQSLIDYVNEIRTEEMFEKFIDQAKLIKEVQI